MQTILMRALPILWAVTIHEYAHGWMAHKCGDDTALYSGRLTLNPLAHLDPIGTLCFLLAGFGWAKPVPVNPYNYRHPSRDDILVSIAGVCANFLSAVAFALVFRLVVAFAAGTPLANMTILKLLLMAVRINLILIFFNLIPIPPLDGSHVLAQLMPLHMTDWYNRNIVPYGMFILVGLLVFGGPLLRIIIAVPTERLLRVLLVY
ncbi:MAG: site-2 protease family protein [Planctomycetes bacterium]|nr:site-2 protease family protein [Planctomycetota bacterium]